MQLLVLLLGITACICAFSYADTVQPLRDYATDLSESVALGIGMSADFLCVGYRVCQRMSADLRDSTLALSSEASNKTSVPFHIEGSDTYKLLMRQRLRGRPHITPNQVPQGRRQHFHPGLQALLRNTVDRPAYIPIQRLGPDIRRLRKAFVKAFGPRVLHVNAVAAIPDYIRNDDRRLFHKLLLDAGFGVGRVGHQSALAVEAWAPIGGTKDRNETLEEDEDEEDVLLDDSTSFVVSLNRASLDLSVVSTSRAYSDRLLHESNPKLGQDLLDLALAQAVSDLVGRGSIDGVVVALRNHSPTQIRRKRKSLTRMGAFERECALTFEDSVKIGQIERSHYQAIMKTVEAFTLKHSALGHGGLMLTAASPIVFSGDADPASFEMLAHAFAKISPTGNFRIAQTASPAEIAAKGAAIVAKRKLVELHEELPLLPHNV